MSIDFSYKFIGKWILKAILIASVTLGVGVIVGYYILKLAGA